ncbi:MAG: response regulator transcription factor [Bacteroidales bacterium]
MQHNEIRILVVDDEADLRQILQFNLQSEGYKVDIASSGEEALEMLDNEYALILLDVMMGGISGFRFAEIVRNEKKEEIPIIFLTAKDTQNDMLTGFNVGGDDYIAKPFSIMEVSARVKAVLRRNLDKNKIAPPKSNTIQFGHTHPILIDLNQKTIHIDKEKIVLTKKEFEILYLLSSNPKQVFSREQILKKVWKDDSYILERTVDVHIARIRKKIGEAGNCIVNRSGYGYCMEEI